MPFAPLQPAELTFNAAGLPWSARYRDIYHPSAGALVQARHVFIHGHDLPQRWQGRERFVVLETGFGLGNNFLATWQAWRDDPQRCECLVFLSIEAHPLRRDDLARVHAASELPELAGELVRAWPPLTADLHQLDFDAGRVRLMLAFGDVQAWLRELTATVDAFDLDGFARAGNPRMWDRRVCKALARLAAPGATVATWSAAHALRADLVSAGFEPRLASGIGTKREITLARYAPAFTPRRSPGRPAAAPGTPHHALIVGAGLAGCAAAWALAEQGWHTTVLERHAHVAAEASGNPAGLFHGIVHAQDGVYARFNRAAALMARGAVRNALAHHGVAGEADGLLRLEPQGSPEAMQALLAAQGLPPDYVQALTPSQASAHAMIDLRHPAWFYPGGGWVDPAGLARAWLERAAPWATLCCGAEAHALRRGPGGWQVLDANGATIAEAHTLVLANAGGAFGLLESIEGTLASPQRPSSPSSDWPVDAVRGQISLLPAAELALPRLPIAGAGYLLPSSLGAAMFGATSQRGDTDPSVRTDDHRANLAQLERLIGQPVAIDPAALQGRTAWRWSAEDRLPLIGAVPDAQAAAQGGSARLDQPRFVPRQPGLYMFTALGSRGITWSALGARLLAAAITGAPTPVEASLVDAVDPARFISRRARRTAAGG